VPREVVRAAKLEREQDGACGAAIRGGGAECLERRRGGEAAAARLRGLVLERLVAPPAARLRHRLDRIPAGAADSSLPRSLDRLRAAGEATRGEQVLPERRFAGALPR